MPFKIVRDDIIHITADAIVNTADPRPLAGGGAEADIYKAAGRWRLLRARKKIGELAPGEAAATSAFRLEAKYVIHTVGPVWRGGDKREEELLASCYRKSLLLAQQLKCKSIVFPLISSGANGFPGQKALDIALREFRDFLDTEDMDITLAVYNKKAFELSKERFPGIDSYIDDNYIFRKQGSAQGLFAGRICREDSFLREAEDSVCMAPTIAGDFGASRRENKKSLKSIMKNVGEDFRTMLFRLIDERGLTDAQVYKKANLDRKLFSKIRCGDHYIPGKQTVLALVFALELNMDETVDLISRAGMALSPGSKFDLILSYCIENGIYDLFDVNSLLFEYDQPGLGE